MLLYEDSTSSDKSNISCASKMVSIYGGFFFVSNNMSLFQIMRVNELLYTETDLWSNSNKTEDFNCQFKCIKTCYIFLVSFLVVGASEID